MKLRFLPLFLSSIVPLFGAITIYDGSIRDTREIPRFECEEHYNQGCLAFGVEDWPTAIEHFNIICLNFPQTPYYHDSQFFLGVAYFYDGELDFANEAFSSYLHCQSNPIYFEQAVWYKLEIANLFRFGAKKRFFGTKQLPKWSSGRPAALLIYDEVVAALPCHEYAAYALYSKGAMQWDDGSYRESVETYQNLIRRFPKHELTPCAYLCICQLYLEQVAIEFQNPDLLALAEINVKKFKRDFPKDERVAEAECMVQEIKELFVRGLFDTGQFYERKCRPGAAAIYYQNAIRLFPDTRLAKCCRNRLVAICPEWLEVSTPSSSALKGEGEDFTLESQDAEEEAVTDDL